MSYDYNIINKSKISKLDNMYVFGIYIYVCVS